MPICEINGIRLNYSQIACESTDVDCEDLVMLHGLATNMAFWFMPYASQFSANYRVTIYDLRGHGRSEISNSGYEAKDMANDLKLFLNFLGIKRAHFIAHSFGGVIALKLASITPNYFYSLILADTHLSFFRKITHQHSKGRPAGKKIKFLLKKQGINLDYNDPYFGLKLLTCIANLQERNIPISPRLSALVRPLLGSLGKRTAMKWLHLIKKTNAEKEMMSGDGINIRSLRKLNFPVLAVYGEHSQALSTGENLPLIIPHVKFKLIKGAGHFFPRSKAKEFLEISSHFLEKNKVLELE